MRLLNHIASPSRYGRRALATFVLALGLFGGELRAVEMGKLMGMTSFKNLVLTIAIVNKSMRDAAENPMDEWRRENVRAAIRLMPAAIAGLAADFQAGKLHNGDLPFVQQLLGGFIDVGAGDNYKKFLASPSKALIPQVSPLIPKSMMNNAPSVGSAGPSGTIAYDDSASRQAIRTGPGATVGKDKSPQSSQIVSLSDAVPSRESTGKPADTARVEFDDSMPRGATIGSPSAGAATDRGPASAEIAVTSGASASTGGAISGSAVDTASPMLRQAANDLSTIESRIAPPKSAADDEDFFKSRKEKVEGTASARNGKKKARSSAENFQLKVSPKYWRLNPLAMMAETLMIEMAQAAGSDCQDCSKGGGGGGGADAAQILFGIAAIMSAIAPMVVASTQAKADVSIAKINADTQLKMTQTTADTSKFLANQQKDIALFQADVAQSVAKQNNDGVTQRLDMQLAELRSARNDAQQAEREKRAIEQEYNQQRIALAEKQADDNLKLAKATLNAQLTQAGLSQGVTSSRNSGDRLTTSRALNPAVSSAGSDLSGSRANTLAQASSGGGLTGLGAAAGAQPARGSTALESQPSTGVAPRAAQLAQVGSQNRLLASVGGSPATSGASSLSRGFFDGNTQAADEEEDMVETIDPKTGKKVLQPRTGGKRTAGAKSARGSARGVAGSAKTRVEATVPSSGLLNYVRSNSSHGIARGSSAGIRLRTAQKSDLGAFVSTAARGVASQPSEEASSFANFRRHQSSTGRGVASGAKEASGHTGGYGGYRPPGRSAR